MRITGTSASAKIEYQSYTEQEQFNCNKEDCKPFEYLSVVLNMSNDSIFRMNESEGAEMGTF